MYVIEGINNTSQKDGELVFDSTGLRVKWTWLVLGQCLLVFIHTYPVDSHGIVQATTHICLAADVQMNPCIR